MKLLAKQLLGKMAELTVLRSAEQALANAKTNLPFVRQTIADLSAARRGQGTASAIVICGGPSLHRRNTVSRIRESGYAGEIIAADGALGVCLRHGLVPDYVVTMDPHPTRICRWFGDPELDSRHEEEDYFRRQDLDPYLGVDEQVRNREMIELVNRHGPSISVAICTSSASNVTHRCLQSGMTLYWWNPLLDDIDQPTSATRQLYQLNKAPCLVSGGNVGTACWVFAHQILGKREVALVGMDLSYAPGTPVENTQYYPELKTLFGARMNDALITIPNPFLEETWYADPAYYWYRECFLQLASQAPCLTYNCTEGGILFGEGVQFVPLEDFLARHRNGKEH